MCLRARHHDLARVITTSIPFDKPLRVAWKTRRLEIRLGF
jgi:hypothetical protein